MRFLHTADWHIGKLMAGYNLLNDQHSTFLQLERIAKEQKVDAVVVAGDLYDRSVPSEAAIRELNRELVTLNLNDHLPVLAISGNHDSATRLGIGQQWYADRQLYLNTQITQAFQPIIIDDVQFFLLPFFGLQQIRNYFHNDAIKDINSAMKEIINVMVKKFAPGKKHVLIAHFFAAGSQRTAESETMIEVGGLSAVNTQLLAPFDYVALGHLHNKNALHEDRVRYSGSPMKFSASEANQDKGVWIVDTDPFSIKWLALPPVHDIHVLEASMNELTSDSFAQRYPQDDYFVIRLKDREVIPDVMSRLRQIYPKIISLSRKYGFTTPQQVQRTQVMTKAPDQLFARFFQETLGKKLDNNQQRIIKETLHQAEKGKEG